MSTLLSPTGRVEKRTRQSTTVALACFTYFAIAVSALYFLNPEYSLLRSFTEGGSYDVLGTHEFFVATTFFSLSVGSFALLFGLHWDMPKSVRSWIGLLLLGVWGTGVLIAGVFPADRPGATVPHLTAIRLAGIFPVEVLAVPDTSIGWIHILASLWSFVSLAFAANLLSWQFKQGDKWHLLHHLALILSLVMLVSLIWLFWDIFFANGIAFEASIATFLEKLLFIMMGLLIGAGLTWLLLTTVYLRFMLDNPNLKR